MPNYLVYLHKRVYTSKLTFSIQSYCGSSSRDLTRNCVFYSEKITKSLGVATLTDIQRLDLQYQSLILVSMAFLVDFFLFKMQTM